MEVMMHGGRGIARGKEERAGELRARVGDGAVLKNRSRRSTVERVRQPEFVAELIQALAAKGDGSAG